MTLSEFTAELKEIVGVTEPKTIPELTEEVYKLASLPKELKEIVSDTSTSFTVPSTVPALRPYAFASCVVLQNATLPDNTTIIPEGAFLDCLALKSVTIPTGVTSIGDQAFKNNISATGVLVIPSTVTEIGNEAFSGSGFSEIWIPNSVGRVGVEAFANCPNLEKVTFPDSGYADLYLASRVFSNSPKLTCIHLPDDTYNRLSPTAFENSGLDVIYFEDMRKPYPTECDPNDCVEPINVYDPADYYDPTDDLPPWAELHYSGDDPNAPENDRYGREPWSVLSGVVFYGVRSADPCNTDIFRPIKVSYKLVERNKRWVCTSDGQPCSGCSGNVQIADYELSIDESNDVPEGYTELSEYTPSYRPKCPCLGGGSGTKIISYNTYESVSDGYPFVGRFMRDTVYSDGTPGSEEYETMETDMVSEVCHAATQHYIYALPETRCLVRVIVGDTMNSETAKTYDMVLTPDKKIKASSLCTCTDVDCAYTIESTWSTPCAVKTNDSFKYMYVNLSDGTVRRFTGEPVDLGPFTVITKEE